jgi:hypothetical protein
MAKMTIEFSKVELENMLAKVLREDFNVELIRMDLLFCNDDTPGGVSVEVVKSVQPSNRK